MGNGQILNLNKYLAVIPFINQMEPTCGHMNQIFPVDGLNKS